MGELGPAGEGRGEDLRINWHTYIHIPRGAMEVTFCRSSSSSDSVIKSEM